MWPDEPYAPPRGSFNRPVPVPSQDPGDTPSLTVSVACSWLPYIRGALQQLLLQATWDTDDPAQLLLTQERAFALIDIFKECNASDLPFSCPYDFESSGGDWSDRASQSGDAPPASAFWDFPVGAWIETCHPAGGGVQALAVDIVRIFPSPVHLTSVAFNYFLSKGSFTNPLGSGIALYTAGFGSLVASNIVGGPSLADTSSATFSWGGDAANVSIVRCLITASSGATCGDVSGGAHILSANVNGIGLATC